MTESLLPTYQMIDIGAILLLVFIVASMAWRISSGTLGFPRLSRRAGVEQKGAPAHPGILSQFVSVLLVDVGTSRPLRTCDRVKWSSHVLIFWGFIFTAIATTLAFFLKPEGAVLPLTNPVKLFGNAGGLLLVVGCAAMFYGRYQESGSMWHLHRSDYFLVALLLTTISGFVTENTIYAFGRGASVTPFVYWTHIALIVSLLATAPYTKFTHAFYKPSWILYQRIGGGQEPPTIEMPGPMTEQHGAALGPSKPDQERGVV